MSAAADTKSKEKLPQSIRIGTRASKLALAQTALVVEGLQAAHPSLQIDIIHITTSGDVDTSRPLRELGDSGLFVSAIETALRTGEIDMAVHSAKDLPSTLPDDMALVAFPKRADARDALISRPRRLFRDLPSGARVGTSSVRRICQLRHLRPDLELVDIRGNVDTRLRKLESGTYDAIVLAKAGLDRLSLTAQPSEVFSPQLLIPAVAQGALALEGRAGDIALASLLSPLDDWQTRLAVLAERGFAARLGGGCHLPIGAFAELDGRGLTLHGMLGDTSGHLVQATAYREIDAFEVTLASAAQSADLGRVLADQLLESGGSQLLWER